MKLSRRALLAGASVAALHAKDSAAFLLSGNPPAVPDIIQAVNLNGQTFVTRPDLATGVSGASFRYALYRSTAGPITAANLGSATEINDDIANNAIQVIGGTDAVSLGLSFTATNRYSVSGLSAKLPNLAQLAYYTCLGVHTCTATQSAWYCILETTTAETVQPGVNAMTVSVAETAIVGNPVRIHYDAPTRPNDPTGFNNPINAAAATISLHASQANGGSVGHCDLGDFWTMFGDTTLGIFDGQQHQVGVISSSGRNVVSPLDTIWIPSWAAGNDANWCGKALLNPPVDPTRGAGRFYPFNHNFLTWILDTLLSFYATPTNKVAITGDCMGGHGAIRFGYKAPTRFAAITAAIGTFHFTDTAQLALNPASGLYSTTISDITTFLMSDGVTTLDHWTNSVLDIQALGATDAPVLLYNAYRHDNIFSWPSQLPGVQTLDTAHQPYMFWWANLGHEGNGGSNPFLVDLTAFDRNQSFPCFNNSSLNDALGTGTLDGNGEYDGDPWGALNVGFRWAGQGLAGSVTDTASQWSCVVDNTWMAKAATPVQTSTLNGAVVAGTTSFTFNSAVNTDTSSFNSLNNSRAQFTDGTEEIFIIATVSSSVVTSAVTRGALATTAASHANGAPFRILPWSPTGPNSGAVATMTVDVTPRFTQSFHPAPGHVCTWTTTFSGGGGSSGSATTDANGKVTVTITIKSGQTTTLTINT